MKTFCQFTVLAVVVAALTGTLRAQTNPATGSASPAPHSNTAIIPVPRTGIITNRQALVLQRAKDASGRL